MTAVAVNTPIIICGFPGIGKTRFSNEMVKELTCDGIRVSPVPRYSLALSAPSGQTVLCDSDSSTFDKANFPENYLSAISQVATYHPKSIQLVSTHDTVLAGLDSLKLPHIVVRPSNELKDQYIQRYKDRGSPEAFCDLMDRMWDRFIKDLINHSLCSLYSREIILAKDEFLSSPRVVQSLFRLG